MNYFNRNIDPYRDQVKSSNAATAKPFSVESCCDLARAKSVFLPPQDQNMQLSPPSEPGGD